MTIAIRVLLLPLLICLCLACSDDDAPPPDTGAEDVVAADQKSPGDSNASDFDAIPPACVSCKGCCQSSECKDGTKPSACGKDGEVCKLCGLQEDCVLGVCEPQG